MAHIAIDARKYYDFGIGTYIQNLVSALAELKSQHTFSLIVSPEHVDRIVLPQSWKSEVSAYKLYSVAELALLGAQAMRMGIDLLHEPHYTLPARLGGRSVVTIHDLIHLKLPMFFSPAQRLYARVVVRHAVRHAGGIIADSQKTKEDILNTFPVREEDVDVVHLGIRHVFRKLEDRAPVESFLAAAGLRRPYVLYVGNIKPHKNVPTLLRAFAQVRRKLGDVMLAFAGGSWSQDGAIVRLAHELGIAESVKDLHHLSDEELVCAYNGADVLALPSLYEGFGLPVLEAMACSTPTVVSAGGSLPEIAGNASVIVDPCEPESLAEALASVISDPEKKRDLVAKGRINLQRFSWRSTGSKTLAVYEKVLKRCKKA